MLDPCRPTRPQFVDELKRLEVASWDGGADVAFRPLPIDAGAVRFDGDASDERLCRSTAAHAAGFGQLPPGPVVSMLRKLACMGSPRATVHSACIGAAAASGVCAFADAWPIAPPNWPAKEPSRFAAIFAVFASAFRDGGGGSTPSASANAVEKWFPLCDTRSYVYGVGCRSRRLELTLDDRE